MMSSLAMPYFMTSHVLFYALPVSSWVKFLIIHSLIVQCLYSIQFQGYNHVRDVSLMTHVHASFFFNGSLCLH